MVKKERRDKRKVAVAVGKRTEERVAYPSKQCNSNGKKGHYFVQLGSEIWRCKYCWTPLWQPASFAQAELFNDNVKKYGLEEAYNRVLNRKPRTKKLILELDKIRIAKKHLTEEEFIKLVVATVTRKEFKLIEETEVQTLHYTPLRIKKRRNNYGQ